MNNQMQAMITTLRRLAHRQGRRKQTEQQVISSLLILVFFLTGTVSARNRKARAVSARSSKTTLVATNYAMPSDDALFTKLASTAIKVGVHPDAIEMTRYAIKRPTHFATVVEHGVAYDYPFFALVGAAKVARKYVPGFTQAKCEFPITVIDQVFAKADSTIDNAKGKQDTNKVVGAAKEYAAEYAKAQTAEAKQELVAKLAENVPYFRDIPVICSFAFETNLKAERDLQNVVTEEVQKLRRAYFAFKDGNYAAGVKAMTELGASANVACELLDESVGGGIIGRTPVLGDLAKGTCKNFTGKVFDGATGLVKGGVGLIEDGVTAAKEFGNSISCTVYSLIGNGCSSATPPDPTTLALNSAKGWCSARGGLKGFDSTKGIALTCNDGSQCAQQPGKPMYCATAQEKAANRAQKAALLLVDLKKLPTDLTAIFLEWSSRCPLADSQCKSEIANAIDEAKKSVDASLANQDAYQSNYFLLTSLPFGVARQKSERAVREAEFRVLPQKWAKDFNAYWLPRCGINQKCVNHMNFTRNLILTSVSVHHQQKPNDPHSATSVNYTEGEMAARNFFKMIDKAFYHAKAAEPNATERAFWEEKIKQDAATYEIILKSVTDEMNKKPAARKLMIQVAYVTAFGRLPTDAEQTYWQPRSENFKELVEASRNWLYSPGGATDFNAVVASVLQFYLQRPPTPNEVSNSVGEYKKKPQHLIFMEMRGAMPALYY